MPVYQAIALRIYVSMEESEEGVGGGVGVPVGYSFGEGPVEFIAAA